METGIYAPVSPFPVEKFEYKLLFKNDFPIHTDHRTEEEMIMDNVVYFFNRFIYKYDEEFYYNPDRDRYEFPLNDIFNHVAVAPDYGELKQIVIKKYQIEENDIVVVAVPVSDDSSSSDFEQSAIEYNDNNCETSHNAADDIW